MVRNVGNIVVISVCHIKFRLIHSCDVVAIIVMIIFPRVVVNRVVVVIIGIVWWWQIVLVVVVIVVKIGDNFAIAIGKHKCHIGSGTTCKNVDPIDDIMGHGKASSAVPINDAPCTEAVEKIATLGVAGGA